MATGGTIPTNRTQTVTFFDTTGIVDKDKNIYFAPRFSKYAQMSSGKDVRSAYLEIFRSVCPPSSDYADIQISGWSPQDRTLKVRGNIDDFRLVTEEGDCLNYFILSRTITNEDIDAVLKTLTPREEAVIRLRFGLKDGRCHTLEEVGTEFQVTRERIRQIEAKALRKLRHPVRSNKFKER